MTTQPQSPSEQEIRTQVENAIAPPVEEVAESGWPNDSFRKAVDDVLALIAQAADKREQEVLESLIMRQELITTWVTAACSSGHRTGGPYSSQLSGGDEDRTDYLRDEVAQRPYCDVCGERREIIEKTDTSVYYDVVDGDKIAGRLAELRQGRAAEGEGKNA